MYFSSYAIHNYLSLNLANLIFVLSKNICHVNWAHKTWPIAAIQFVGKRKFPEGLDQGPSQKQMLGGGLVFGGAFKS